ncbi:hypothetical protein Tco_0137978 [Tanacetum coccineum]
MSHIRAMYESIGFDCLLNINDQFVPRFVLEFYSQLTFDYNSTGHFVVNFVIQSQVTRTKNKKTIVVDKNEIQPHMKPWVDIIRENAICLADRGKKRPCESNASSSSSTLNHSSSFHPLDDALDENDDESFHSNSSSMSQNISSSSNVVSRVRQNPPHESHNLNTYLSETINLQTQQRDAHREGLRSIGQALKNMMGGKRK